MRLLLVMLMSFGFVACTSKVNEGAQQLSAVTSSAAPSCVGAACAVCDLPWGGTLAAGQSLNTVFSQSLVECSQSCDIAQAKLSCKDGVLLAQAKDGKALNINQITNSCFRKRCDCEVNATTVQDGSRKKFYRANNPGVCGGTCSEREFECTAGKMLDVGAVSGVSTIVQYPLTSCSVVACKDCTTPWGAKLAHNASVTAYDQEVSSCTVSCTATGHRATLSCKDGVLSGADTSLFKFGVCTTRVCQTCTSPCGQTISSGGFNYCFKTAVPATCGLTCDPERKKFSCLDGTVTPEDNSPIAANSGYSNRTCTEQAACTSCPLPDRQILDGGKVTFFKSATAACGVSCFAASNAVTLTCSNGQFANRAIYSDFKETTCTNSCTSTEGDKGIGRINGDGGGAPVHLCKLPWGGGMVTGNTTVVAYSRVTPPAGQKCSAYKAMITCNAYKGLWTGGGVFIYPTCREP